MEKIETKRFELLKVEMADAEAIFDILSNENVITNLNTKIHKTIDDTKKMLEEYEKEYKENKKFPYKIIDKQTGEFIGVFLIKLDLYDEDYFEFTVYLNEKHWGKGVYTEVLPYMIDAAFNVAKTGNFRGFVMEKNIASRKVLEKSDMKLEKVFDVPGINEPIYSFLITRKEWEEQNKRN